MKPDFSQSNNCVLVIRTGNDDFHQTPRSYKIPD